MSEFYDSSSCSNSGSSCQNNATQSVTQTRSESKTSLFQVGQYATLNIANTEHQRCLIKAVHGSLAHADFELVRVIDVDSGASFLLHVHKRTKRAFQAVSVNNVREAAPNEKITYHNNPNY